MPVAVPSTGVMYFSETENVTTALLPTEASVAMDGGIVARSVALRVPVDPLVLKLNTDDPVTEGVLMVLGAFDRDHVSGRDWESVVGRVYVRVPVALDALEYWVVDIDVDPP